MLESSGGSRGGGAICLQFYSKNVLPTDLAVVVTVGVTPLADAGVVTVGVTGLAHAEAASLADAGMAFPAGFVGVVTVCVAPLADAGMVTVGVTSLGDARAASLANTGMALSADPAWASPADAGLRAQATDQHREEPLPLYIRESRPNPANIDVDITGTGETGSLVGSFPGARLVLGEGAENPCVRRSCPE